MTLPRKNQGKGKPGGNASGPRRIPLIRPFINESVKKRVCEVLDSGFLTEGPVTGELEGMFREYVECAHAIAVTSCTTGLELALRALNVGPGDEVIVPDYTYPATADAVAIVGATVVLVDVSRDTMLIDYDKLEQAVSERTKAVIPVSLFGNPLDYDRLNEIKKVYGISIIEDSACSIGASYRGVKVGNLADISVFSLHPRKFITTGEGGIITTSNPGWAEWMLSYKHFGMRRNDSRSDIIFERIGSNYKMSDVLAAIALEQMRVIDQLLFRRRELAENYKSLLSGLKEISIPECTRGGNHSFQSFCIYVRQRDQVMKKMREAGIEVQIGTYALHMHPAFASARGGEISGSLSGSNFAYSHCLALPLYHDLTPKMQAYIATELKQLL
jgi:perosamine synthetase